MLGRALWPSSAAPAAAGLQSTSTNAAKPALRRTASGKFVKVSEPRLDPTLDLDLLRQTEQIKYAGNARNIFMPGSLPIEAVKKNPALDHPAPAVQTTPPSPPINLKFFGFANKPG